jgi:hypothetical protein
MTKVLALLYCDCIKGSVEDFIYLIEPATYMVCIIFFPLNLSILTFLPTLALDECCAVLLLLRSFRVFSLLIQFPRFTNTTNKMSEAAN